MRFLNRLGLLFSIFTIVDIAFGPKRDFEIILLLELVALVQFSLASYFWMKISEEKHDA